MEITQAIVIKQRFFVPGSKSHNWYRSNKTSGAKGKKGSPKSNLDYLLNKGNCQITTKTSADGNVSYVDYQTRSGRAGTHYWTNLPGDEIPVIPKDSLVWDMVVSFDKEYARVQGIQSKEQTEVLIRETIGTFWKNNGLDPKNMAYVAVHHNDTDNHHIHLRINEISPSKAFNGSGHLEFTKKGKCKDKSFLIMKQHIDMVSNKTQFMWADYSKNQDEFKKMMIDNSIKQKVRAIPIARAVQDIVRANNKKGFKTYGNLDNHDQKLIDSYFGMYLKRTNIVNEYKHFQNNKTENYHNLKLQYPDYFDDKNNASFRERNEEYDTALKNDFIKLCVDIDKIAPPLPAENFAIAGNAKSQHKLKIGSISSKRLEPSRGLLEELMVSFDRKHKRAIDHIDQIEIELMKYRAHSAGHRGSG